MFSYCSIPHLEDHFIVPKVHDKIMKYVPFFKFNLIAQQVMNRGFKERREKQIKVKYLSLNNKENQEFNVD